MSRLLAVPAFDYPRAVLETKHRQARGAEYQALSFFRREIEPACRQDSQNVAVAEKGHVSARGQSAFDDRMGAFAHLCDGFAPRDTISPEIPAGAFLSNIHGCAALVCAVIPFDEIRLDLRL